jgi:hypothetical protein
MGGGSLKISRWIQGGYAAAITGGWDAAPLFRIKDQGSAGASLHPPVIGAFC